jgi:4-aminobutyrate aminotransferase-like enzyme
MQRLKLVERAAELETYLRGKLEALNAKHLSFGDGRGLFWLNRALEPQSRDSAKLDEAYSRGFGAAGRA